MLIARSTFSRALAHEGNRLRETLRLKSTCECVYSEEGWYPFDGEDMSLSVSELASASLHHMMVVKPPDRLKPATDREEMSECTCRAIRGDWRRRVSKERRGIPGGPLQCLNKGQLFEQRVMGNHNHCLCWQRESERFILATKWSNVHGAKGPHFNHVSMRARRSA